MPSALDAIAATVNPQSQTSGAGAKKPASAGDPRELASKETFLKMLVAQIRNQNPLKPADGVEFLSQLAQFSQLEQLINVKQELQGLRDDLKPPDASGDRPSAPSIPLT